MAVKCPLCGYRFNPDEVKNICAACPVNYGCNKICCPNCHYSWLESSSWIGKLFGLTKGESRNKE